MKRKRNKRRKTKNKTNEISRKGKRRNRRKRKEKGELFLHRRFQYKYLNVQSDLFVSSLTEVCLALTPPRFTEPNWMKIKIYICFKFNVF